MYKSQFWANKVNSTEIVNKPNTENISKYTENMISELIRRRIPGASQQNTTIPVNVKGTPTLATLNIKNLYEITLKTKKHFMSQFFNGNLSKTFKIKTKPLSNLSIKSVDDVPGISSAHKALIQTALTLATFDGIIDYIDFLNNKIKINNQVQKLSKVIKTQLSLIFPEKIVDQATQEMSVVWDKGKKAQNELVFKWTADPADFIRQSDDEIQSCHRENSGITLGKMSNSNLPWVSQAADRVTTMIFTYNNNGGVQSRIALYINAIDKQFSFGRSYPRNIFGSGSNANILINVRKKLKQKKYQEVNIYTTSSFSVTQELKIPKTATSATNTTWLQAEQTWKTTAAYSDFSLKTNPQKENVNWHKTIYAQDKELDYIIRRKT